MDLLRASLELPPSVNHLYANRKGGGKCLTEQARLWREAASLILKSANTWKDVQAIDQARKTQAWLTFRIQAFLPPNKLRRDVDNLAKITQDTVAQVVDIDDSQIYDLYISKRPLRPKQAAFVLVTLATLETEEHPHGPHQSSPISKTA